MIKVIAFDKDDFRQIDEMRQRLHNSERSMTFDEQRDFAERLRLLLARGVEIEVQG